MILVLCISSLSQPNNQCNAENVRHLETELLYFLRRLNCLNNVI